VTGVERVEVLEVVEVGEAVVEAAARSSRFDGAADLVIRHDQRQVDLGSHLIEVRPVLRCGTLRRIQLEHPTAFVLRTRQSLDLNLFDLLRIQLDIFLDFEPIGSCGGVGARVEADWILKVLDFWRRRRWSRRSLQLNRRWLLVLDREIRLGHRRRGGSLAFGARQRFGGVSIHRVGVQEPRQPLHLFSVLAVPLGELRESAQGDDVFTIEAEDLLEDAQRRAIVFLVDEAPGVDRCRR